VVPFLREKVKSFVRNSAWPFCRKWLLIGILFGFIRSRLNSAVEQTLRKFIVACLWYLLLLTPCSIFVLQVQHVAGTHEEDDDTESDTYLDALEHLDLVEQ
jgi:hypothetical protein